MSIQRKMRVKIDEEEAKAFPYEGKVARRSRDE